MLEDGSVPGQTGRARAGRGVHPAIGNRQADLEAVVTGDCRDPFGFLGMHLDGPGRCVTVRVFYPGVTRLEVLHAGGAVTELERVHPAGFWAAALREHRERFPYRLRAMTPSGLREFDDTYRFAPVLGDLDVHLLAEGTHLRTYERLGARPMEMAGVAGTAWAVWAPNARRVSLVGDFCDWDGRRLPMRLRHECGVWELFVPGVGPGVLYKFEIKGPSGNLLPLKADPYAFHAEHPPRTASVVPSAVPFAWQDQGWLVDRPARNDRHAPISIYEVHLGSWRRKGEHGRERLSYRELADTLVSYGAEMGFSHIELMPVSEHPFDGSWGYQPISLYAPTSRFGPPEDFAYFIDRCHAAGIGVLMDWVPGHFPTDPHGLGYFDGTHLYEHADPRQGFHPDWNTLIFNYGRREVTNYLLGNALFWLERFHLDGLRVDAVASMLYLNYSRRAGEWIPNAYGGNENLDAIAFLKRMNEITFREQPGITTVAEESTAWPAVSRPTYLGGLGFGFKWNMGWMHDTLRYMSLDPIHRRWHHNDITFGLLYAFHENFVLPLSHDEVVHGKRSLIGRMPGDRWRRFANLRAYFGFMFGHPGKKLLFMGGEFAQEREWNHDESLDWHLLNEPPHQGVQALIRDLNRLYREWPALHVHDCEPEGFEWLVVNDAENGVLAFLRRGRPEHPPVLVACNFTPVPRQGYRIGVPAPGRWRELVNTDSRLYGGSNMGNAGGLMADGIAWGNKPYSLSLTLPPLSTVMLAPEAG
ncbi:MAG TPA: 1,4-alpha-glucan branching protein GlgB [Stellaceae bacterium]|nr:1,4-alpha-glucan branching protein GlgB [Stellaceae bacterium]